MVRRVAVAALLVACKLQPPPVIDPMTERTEQPAPPLAEQEPPPPAEDSKALPAPGPQDPDSAKLEMMMADPDCKVEVVELLKSARGLWSDTKKNTCTYEVVINGQRYKYTRQVPRDRRREPEEVCQRAFSGTESAVRAATRDCKDLTAADRPITGLVPIR